MKKFIKAISQVYISAIGIMVLGLVGYAAVEFKPVRVILGAWVLGVLFWASVLVALEFSKEKS